MATDVEQGGPELRERDKLEQKNAELLLNADQETQIEHTDPTPQVPADSQSVSETHSNAEIRPNPDQETQIERTDPTPKVPADSHPVSETHSLPVTEAEGEDLAADPKPETLIESNANDFRGQNPPANNDFLGQDPPANDRQLLRNDQGNRTFTMRELLNGLKASDQGNDGITDSEPELDSQGGSAQNPHKEQNDAAMELINSVTGVDEEGRSRQRILTFAARRYASAIERNPEDYDAFYNWALVLQESADNVSPDSGSPSKDSLLEEACKKYDDATRLCPTLHDAFYNWAIAISDRAKMRGRTKEAEELWKQATKNYEKAVQLNWNSPQALNNWGLALQELSSIVPAREKQKIVKTAISKFRAAIQLQFDFHRAIYNLGTVLYGLAEDTLRTGGSVSAKDVSPNELYSQSAIYIAAAHALKPNYSVYSSALRLVRSMLPLPYLKVGYLTAPPAGKPVAPHNEWKRSEFLLNHERLQQVDKTDQREFVRTLSGRQTDSVNGDERTVKVAIPDIVSVSACADLTLPPGAGLCVDTIHGPFFLVADSWESLDGWLDAIRLVYTIYARGKSDVLAGIITG